MKQRVSQVQAFLFVFAVLFVVEILLHYFNFGIFDLFLFNHIIYEKPQTLLTDSVAILSPALYNIYFYYILGCGFILLFIMLGVVLLLSDWAFPGQSETTFTATSEYVRKYHQQSFTTVPIQLVTNKKSDDL